MRNSLYLFFLSALLSPSVFAQTKAEQSVSPWQVFTFKIGIRAGCMESEYRESQSLKTAWQVCGCVMQHFNDALDDKLWYPVTRQIMIEGKSLEDIPQLETALKKIPLCTQSSSNEHEQKTTDEKNHEQ